MVAALYKETYYRLRRYLMQQAMARIIKTSWTTAEKPLRDIRSLGSSDDRGSIPYLLAGKPAALEFVLL